MKGDLELEVASSNSLTKTQRAEILALCNRAFREDLTPFFRTITDATHVVGTLGDKLISHALWITRWLQCNDNPPLRTAYVELVATDPDFQRRGFATAVMQRLVCEIVDFDLAALSPAIPDFYLKLGWVFWRGPLFIRSPEGLIPTPEESVMVLHLTQTPRLDLEAPLSAEWREGELW